MIIDEAVYVEHHGVKGQKWGVRRERDTSSSGGSSKIMKTKVGEIDEALYPAIAYATAIVGVVGFVKVNAFFQSGKFHSMNQRGKRFVEGRPLWNENKKLADKNMSVDDIMKNVVAPVNAHGGIGSKANCRRCTFAYEMRRRGYDVAATRTTMAYGQDASGVYNAITPGQKIKPGIGALRYMHKEQVKKKSGKAEAAPFSDFVKKFSLTGTQRVKPDEVFSAIAKQPPGARGELGIKWLVPGGHSVAYENVKGKPVLFDCQSGKKYNSMDEFKKDFKYGVMETGLTRLDNQPMNDAFLTRWLKDA